MRRYRDYNSYLREIFGERVQKISIDAGFGCPNRNGLISDEGCIFCDSRGSGSGAFINDGLSIEEQIMRAREGLKRRYGAKKFIAYFQSFTNTYAPAEHLKELYDRILLYEDIVGLSVATRPDCLENEALELLCSYMGSYLVWVELGLQSSHDETLRRINRGHDVACFEHCVDAARKLDLNICVHVILGLPGENRAMIMDTARFLAKLPIQGVKIHLLYVVEGTPLAHLYGKGEFRCLEKDEYVDMVIEFLELLPEDFVIQRLTGDPPKSELVAPLWATKKAETLSLIREKMEKQNTWQGRRCEKFT